MAQRTDPPTETTQQTRWHLGSCLKALPLQLVLIVPLSVQIGVAVGAVSYLSLRNGEQSLNKLVNNLHQKVCKQVGQHLDRYLSDAPKINELNTRVIRSGLLTPKDPKGLALFFEKQAQAHSVGRILLGTKTGELVVVERSQMNAEIAPPIPLKTLAIQKRDSISLEENRGKVRGKVLSSPAFQREAWYAKLLKTNQPQWTSPYFGKPQDPNTFAIALSHPVHDSSGKLIGVLAVEENLAQLNQFLRSLKVSPHAIVFIVDRDGGLIASSSDQPPYQQMNGKFGRVAAVNSPHPIIQATAQQALQSFGSFDVIRSSQQFQGSFQQQRQWIQVMPWQYDLGLKWMVVSVIPESDFTHEIQTHHRTTLLLCVGALLAATVTGILTARWITRSLLKLNAAVEAISQGNWQQQIGTDRIREIHTLAGSIDRMATQLHQMFAEKEMLNQALARSRDQISQVLEALPIGIIVLFPEYKDFYFNQAAEKILGRGGIQNLLFAQIGQPYQLYRTGTDQLYPPEELPVIRALQGETVNVDDLEIQSNGQRIPIEVQAIPVYDEYGQLLYAIAAFQDVTARRQTEAALREQEAQFRRIAESAPGMLFQYAVHADGRSEFTYVSPRCREIFEIEPSIAQQNSQILWHSVEPADLRILQQQIAHSRQTLDPINLDFRITTPSGTLKWIQAPCCPVAFPNGSVIWDGIAVDVTALKHASTLLGQYNAMLERQVHDRTIALQQEILERKHAEAALRDSEAQNRAIVEAIPDLMFCVDSTGTFLGYFKTNYVVDLIPGDIDPIGQPIARMLPEEVAQRHLFHLHQAITTGQLVTYEQETRIHDKLQYEEVRMMPIGMDRVLCLVRDISERVRLEHDRQCNETTLQQAKEAAETANRAKSTFIANMSHELRTPLNAILGFAKIMSRDPATTATQQHSLQIINQSGEHLLSLINSVLDLSKIEAGRMEPINHNFDLPELVQAVVAMLGERAASKGLHLQLHLASEVPQWVSTDSGKLRQVLINLIGNAIKFTDHGEIQVRVTQKSKPSPGSLPLQFFTLQFEVEDTGIGIDPEQIDRVFDAFTQIKSSNQFSEGSGLGLSLCQKFVELLGGTIALRSTPGQGSCFTVEIPVVVESWETQTTQYASSSFLSEISVQSGERSHRILVVDDQPDNCELLVHLLAPFGWEIQTASNGHEAIEAWQQWNPDVIVMDIRMPRMSGLEAIQQIRDQEQRGNRTPTRIIALSATVFENDRTAAYAAGCDIFLSKPFRESELLDAIAHPLGLPFLYSEPNFSPPAWHSRPEIPPSDLPAIEPSLFQTLPKAWVLQLYQVTLSCDETQILELLQQLPEEQAAVRASLEKLARQFEFDRILAALEAYPFRTAAP